MRERRAVSVWMLLGALVVASALCVAIVEYRGRYEAGPFYRFLDWNLFLAWLPVVFALTATACVRVGLGALAIVPGVLWLLFFPNAPYMLTDFIHLQESPATPLWYDGLMLSAFAWTALLLGFFSLYLMQLLVLRLFGVYIGRFIGFNSWDALLHPGRVAHVIDTRVESPVDHPRLAGSLVILTSFLTVAYAVFYGIAGLRLELEHESPGV